jgi:CTP synthase
VPISLEESGIGEWLVDELNLSITRNPEEGLAAWRRFVEEIRSERPTLHIGLVGKYVELEDAYFSVKESLMHAGLAAGWHVDIEWISSEDLEKGRHLEVLESVDGFVVPGGFGYRGIEGKIVAARYARENRVPYLGLCLGMQVMCIELARHILDSDEPNSTEFDLSTEYPIIDLMPDQRDIADMGGTMRLGTYPCELTPGTKTEQLYRGLGYGAVVHERHRHRFEFNNHFRAMMETNGVVFSGVSPDGRLVEISELSDHPFMIGSQFHPEFKSRPNKPHPLFLGLIQAAKTRHFSRTQPEASNQESKHEESLTSA